jgi:DNA-binding protein H-NS
MAKTLSSIMSQIERLQKEAAALQTEAVMRIRKEIAKFGLTPEQLFGGAAPRKTAKAKGAAPKAAKFADGAGNTWGGRGKRPDWLRQALAAGRALEEFLVVKSTEPAAKKRAPRKKAAAAAKPKAAPKKRAAARKTAARKTRAKPAPAAAN